MTLSIAVTELYGMNLSHRPAELRLEYAALMLLASVPTVLCKFLPCSAAIKGSSRGSTSRMGCGNCFELSCLQSAFAVILGSLMSWPGCCSIVAFWIRHQEYPPMPAKARIMPASLSAGIASPKNIIPPAMMMSSFRCVMTAKVIVLVAEMASNVVQLTSIPASYSMLLTVRGFDSSRSGGPFWQSF